MRLPVAKTFSEIAPGQKIVSAFVTKGKPPSDPMLAPRDIIIIVTETAIFEVANDGVLRQMAFIDPMDESFVEQPPETEEQVIKATWNKMKDSPPFRVALLSGGVIGTRAIRGGKREPDEAVSFQATNETDTGKKPVVGWTRNALHPIKVGDLNDIQA